MRKGAWGGVKVMTSLCSGLVSNRMGGTLHWKDATFLRQKRKLLGYLALLAKVVGGFRVALLPLWGECFSCL